MMLCFLIAQEGHLNCLMWLAKHSGTAHNDMSVDGMTAAHAAAHEGHLELNAGVTYLARASPEITRCAEPINCESKGHFTRLK